MSCSLCCFKTFNLCGLRDYIVNMAAFHPPKDHKYEIFTELQNPPKPPIYRLMVSDPKGNKYVPKDPEGIETSVFWLQTKSSRMIPAVFLDNKKATSNFVLLYSHGNSTDLGLMRLSLQELSLALSIHVFAYEYTGYGPAKGSPNDIDIIFGITTAYQFLIERLKIKWYQIILYGRSIGTGPSLYLASHPKYPVSGVILHSPLASGLRILNLNMKKTHSKDLFPNSEFISHVNAFVFIMHGEEDVEVPVAHGKLLSTRCKKLYSPWWVHNGSHNDIDSKFRKMYFVKLSKFIKHVKDYNLGRTEKELEDFYKVDDWHKGFDHFYFTQAPKIEERYYKHVHAHGVPKGSEYASFASNASFLTSQNVTNVTFKTNTESIITTLGDQTARKNGEESTRSVNERDTEERKGEQQRPSNTESCHKSKSSDIELSYSLRSPAVKNETKAGSEEECGSKSEPTNTVQMEEPLPNEVSFDQSRIVINEIRNVKVEPSYRGDETAR